MNQGINQPWLALVTAIFTVAISFSIIAVVGEHLFHTWVSFGALAMIPTQIYISVVKRCAQPAWIARMRQPLRGLAFTGLIGAAGAIIGPIVLLAVNGGIKEPTPFAVIFAIFSVVTLLWLAEIFHELPWRGFIKSDFLVGVLVLGTAYVAAYVGFQLYFNFDHMSASPIYDSTLDPGGRFSSWVALSFAVTSAAAILVSVSLFEGWAGDKAANRVNARFRGVASVFAQVLFTMGITVSVFALGTVVFAMETVSYLVQFPVSFIFGVFITQNMMERRLFVSYSQPLKGVYNFMTAAIAGAIMYQVYQWAAPFVNGAELRLGAPSYQLERWVAAALLSVTFPVVVVITAFFNFWPFKPSVAVQNDTSAAEK